MARSSSMPALSRRGLLGASVTLLPVSAASATPRSAPPSSWPALLATTQRHLRHVERCGAALDEAERRESAVRRQANAFIEDHLPLPPEARVWVLPENFERGGLSMSIPGFFRKPRSRQDLFFQAHQYPEHAFRLKAYDEWEAECTKVRVTMGQADAERRVESLEVKWERARGRFEDALADLLSLPTLDPGATRMKLALAVEHAPEWGNPLILQAMTGAIGLEVPAETA